MTDRIELAVDFVNSWDEFPTPHDRLDAGWLGRWLVHHGLPEAAAGVEEADVPRARAFRSRIESVFDAGSEGEAVAILNALAAELGTPPRLERAGDGWEIRSWPVHPPGLDTGVGLAAVGLLEAIRDLGFERFGRCAGTPCRCVYVDRSRNRRRRFCCELCADRVAQASYRRRRSAAG